MCFISHQNCLLMRLQKSHRVHLFVCDRPFLTNRLHRLFFRAHQNVPAADTQNAGVVSGAGSVTNRRAQVGPTCSQNILDDRRITKDR